MGGLTYYPTPPAVGLIPPFPAGWGVYTPGTPGFLDLVNSLEGDAGDASDGFDDAFALASSAVDAIGDLMSTGDPLVDEVSSAADDFNSITDEISDELEAATALYDTAEAGLLTAIAIQEAGLNEPGPFSIPGLPALASVALPDALDLLGMVYQAMQNAFASFVTMVENYVLSAVSAAFSSAGGGVSTELGPPIDFWPSEDAYFRKRP